MQPSQARAVWKTSALYGPRTQLVNSNYQTFKTYEDMLFSILELGMTSLGSSNCHTEERSEAELFCGG